MSTADLEATVAAFRKAGELAKAAGFDGVEPHRACCLTSMQFESE